MTLINTILCGNIKLTRTSAYSMSRACSYTFAERTMLSLTIVERTQNGHRKRGICDYHLLRDSFKQIILWLNVRQISG